MRANEETGEREVCERRREREEGKEGRRKGGREGTMNKRVKKNDKLRGME